ncbi:hypothetical protein SAY86_015950 [Trapa natans]|uniref:Uncharacterized protein n=1 Tax=Trapa natans TaxID=22666 RepID=A0AAN7R0W8_TRANT|nr:hypothetical protein SAY86_015950 [Trapa natans]
MTRSFGIPTIFLLLCIIALAANGATRLPDDEVNALMDIGKALNKTWDKSVNPCNGSPPWYTSEDDGVVCNCSSLNDTFCHVTSITLKSQSLQGTLPPDFIRLPYLQNIDLTRNYLNGVIPHEWGRLPNILNISLLGNRLTGSIPKEIGNLSTLESIVLEANYLSGKLPEELGNLPHIQRLLLSSNNFSGEIPPALAKLSTLKDLRINDNQFSGKIPSFINNWTNLTKLIIQASGLQGPIPSTIQDLGKLSDLRISDLNGTEAKFPNLTSSTTSLKTLILRNCNLIGELPQTLKDFTTLKVLDLSFNKLNGTIPQTYSSLDLERLYLTENLLTGPVPDRVRGEVDLSFNNFTGSTDCQLASGMNLFTSSSADNNSGIASCLKSSPCSTDFRPPRDSKISAGAVAGIVISIIFAILLIVGILWWRGCFGRNDTRESDLKGLDLQTGSFTLRQIRAATNNFSPDNKIGEGGFGSVYKRNL